MKKVIAVFVALVMALTCMTLVAGAVDSKNPTSLKFNEDGTFKIMMMNDWQDRSECKEQTVEFITAVLEQEQPDLVVLNGDQLCDIYPNASVEDFVKAIGNFCKIFNDAGIPFMATMGNHDHDREATLSEQGQYDIYNAYEYFINTENGPAGDPFTCYLPIMSSDGSKMVMNVYVMDSNNTGALASYTGVTTEQVEWYNGVSAQLKAENGGEVVPSLLFQHVPVKEIYQLLRVCDYNDDGAIYARRDGNWYCLADGVEGELGEAPCSEDFSIVTGQYQAWVENGDIMGAFFAHDHVNTFSGTTADGIRMGYNGGSGFRSYGKGGNRSVRIFNITEDDPTNYETHLLTYNEVTGKNQGTTLEDLLTPAILNNVMKVVYFFFGWIIKLFK